MGLRLHAIIGHIYVQYIEEVLIMRNAKRIGKKLLASFLCVTMTAGLLTGLYTYKNNKEVKAATEELENARRAVVQKTTVDVGGNQNNAGQNTNQKGQAVQTGDEGNLLPIVLVMVACIAIITVVIIRRKRK